MIWSVLFQERQDKAYMLNFYKQKNPDGSVRAYDIGTHLEVHVESATEAGTFLGLTQQYQGIARKVQANIDSNREPYFGLSAAEQHLVGFDSIELMPEVPPAEREALSEQLLSGQFFQPSQGNEALTQAENDWVSIDFKTAGFDQLGL